MELNEENNKLEKSISDFYSAFPNGNQIHGDIVTEPPKYKGLMGYDHKTGGTIQIFRDPDTFNEVKQATARRGQSSILRKTTPRT